MTTKMRRQRPGRGAVAGLAVVLLVLLGSAWPGTLRAGETLELEVSGQRLIFEAPEDYCILDPARRGDRLALEMVRRGVAPQNRLLAYFMNCRDYRDLQAGTVKLVNRFALIMIPGVNVNPDPHHRNLSRAAFVSQLRAYFSSDDFMRQVYGMTHEKFDDLDLDHVLMTEQLGEEITGEPRRLLEETRSEILAGRLNLFSLGDDEESAYVGYAIPFAGETQAGVGAMSLVNEISIMIASYGMPASVRLYDELKQEAGWMMRRAIDLSEG